MAGRRLLLPWQSCPGHTGEIWAGGLLQNIQEAFHLCGRKNEKFPLDFMKIKRIMQSTNRGGGREPASALTVSPNGENGQRAGQSSWAAEGRANRAVPLVAWDGSLCYRAGECWLSVEGLLPFPIWEMSRASKVAPQIRIFRLCPCG